MGRNKIILLSASAILSSCANAKGTSSSSAESSEIASSVSSSSVQTKELYFPTDTSNTTSDTGVDVFMGYDDYRITHMYTGEGVEEEITGYTYNEKYCTIDSNGRVHPISEGSSKAYAITKSGSHQIKINVKNSSSFNNWISQSASTMKANYEKRNSPKNAYIFMGDSFFDSRDFWDEDVFYNTFAGKNVFITGIGTAKTSDWMTIKKEYLIDYEPSAIFVNLGVNNLINAGDNGKTCAAKLMTLFDELHYMRSQMKIYYYGIIKSGGTASWNDKSAASNALMKEYCEKNSEYMTYLDIPSLVDDNIGSYLKSDNLHPNSAAYLKFAELAKEHM